MSSEAIEPAAYDRRRWAGWRVVTTRPQGACPKAATTSGSTFIIDLKRTPSL